MNTKSDYYQLLGLTSDASNDQVRARFKRLIRENHPDVNGGDTSSSDTTAEVIAAYQTLSDPEKRREYDRILELRAAQSRFETTIPPVSSQPSPVYGHAKAATATASKGAPWAGTRPNVVAQRMSAAEKAALWRSRRPQLVVTAAGVGIVLVFSLIALSTYTPDWTRLTDLASSVDAVLGVEGQDTGTHSREPAWRELANTRLSSLRSDYAALLPQARETILRANEVAANLVAQGDGSHADAIKDDLLVFQNDVARAGVDIRTLDTVRNARDATRVASTAEEDLNDVRAGNIMVLADMQVPAAAESSVPTGQGGALSSQLTNSDPNGATSSP